MILVDFFFFFFFNYCEPYFVLEIFQKKKKKLLVFDSYGFGRIHIAVDLGLDSIVFLKVNDVLSKTS